MPAGIPFSQLSGDIAPSSGIYFPAINLLLPSKQRNIRVSLLTLSGMFGSSFTGSFTGIGVTGSFYPLNNPSGYITTGQTGSFITSGQTGLFYPINNPSGYITGDLSLYALKSQTGSFITANQTGNFVITSQTGAFYPVSNPNGYITGVNLTPYVQTGATGIFVTTGQTGVFYPVTNPSGYITGVNLTPYVQTGATGIFVTTGQTGVFYPVTNPSGYITSASLPTDVVFTTGDQTIHGNKLFVDDITIRNLTVTGTQTIVNTQIVDIGTNYVYLNVSGGVRDAGLFIDFSGDPSLGGAMIGWDVPSNTWRIGTGIPNSDLSGLSHIASQEWVVDQQYIITSQTGAFYPASNPNNYITGLDLSSYALKSQTGTFITTGQTGVFYPTSNPSGYITGVDLSSYIQTGATGNFATISPSGNFPSGLSVGGLLNFNSSLQGSSFSLGASPIYVHTGLSLDTGTMPTIASSINQMYFIKNRGAPFILTGNGSDKFYLDSPAGGVIMNSGDAYTVYNDGSYWNIM